MTPDELAAIEARANAANAVHRNRMGMSDPAGDWMTCTHASQQDVPALVAEVRRLQALVPTAGWTGLAPAASGESLLMPLASRRAEVSRTWPKATGVDAEALRAWVIHGDYSNVLDPWHSLIEQWEASNR